MLSTSVNPDLFQCVETGALDNLDQFEESDFRPFLPILVRSSLIQAGDLFGRPAEFRQKILVALSDLESVNSLVALLSVDFQVLEGDVKKELQLRQKFGNRDQDSVLVMSLKEGLALEYERSDATRRLRLVLSETLYIMSQILELRPDYYMKASELFDCWVYLEEICDTISIALVELPNILNLLDVCEAMLHVRNGPWIICRLVANMPDSFVEVCFHLISNGDKCEEESDGGKIRLDALRMLCKMNPRQILLVRARCVEQCRMPALTVFLSLETEDVQLNLIPFLSGILLGNDQQIRNWFSLYIRNGQKRKVDSVNSVLRMREAIWNYLRNILSEARHKSLKEREVVQASSLLRLACALKGIAGFKFYDDETVDLVGLITLKAPNSPPGHRFITLGLCTLLACPTLISSTEQEKIVIEWIKSILKEDTSSSNNCGLNSSFGEILLLMAIHFHSNQLGAIADLVCATLGMKIAIRINTLTRIKQIFTQEIFTEQVVTAHAVRVPVTTGLNADIAGFLPVHCIYQLIKSRAFTKHQVPIKDWVYRQLLSTKLPLHPVLPALLEVYTQSILVPGTGTNVGGAKVFMELTNEPLSNDEVLAVFNDFQTKNLAPQLLILYYLLLYEDNRQIHCRNLISLGRKVKVYSGKLFSQIPIKFLLQEAQKCQYQCGGLFPSLLKLLSTHFPQLCTVNEWIEDSVMLTKDDTQLQICLQRDPVCNVSAGSIEKSLSGCIESPGNAIQLLETLLALQPNKLWPHAKEIVQQMHVIIDSRVPRKIQDLFRDVWYRLNNVFPRHLWELTSNALLPYNSVQLTVEELTIDPIQILKCDPKVFRCAPVMNILLHILSASLASSKYFLSKHSIENPIPPSFGGNNDAEREELKLALMAIQDSATVQILLEACIPSETEKKSIGNDLCLKEIQSLVCSFLHQMFIADPTLAKLVHFQGYPLELLPVTVRGIPSMHICADFIPELLNQPETSKQVFAVQLISHLSMQYALPKSFNIARISLSTMNSMASGVVSEDRAEFFIPALSALERLSEAFPPLVEEIVTLLMHLGKICVAQNSVERNRMCKIVRNKLLLKRVYETYDSILKHSMLERKIF